MKTQHWKHLPVQPTNGLYRGHKSLRKGLVIFYILQLLGYRDSILEIFHFIQKNLLLKSSYPKQQSSTLCQSMPTAWGITRIWCIIQYITHTFYMKEALGNAKKISMWHAFCISVSLHGKQEVGVGEGRCKKQKEKLVMNTSIADLRSSEGFP